MKTTILIGLLGLAATVGFSQTTEIDAVKKVITAFSLAGDKNDAIELANYLDDNHRLVMNRLFGSKEVSIMTKAVYVEKVRTKEYGGDNRALTIENVVINGTAASAKVIFKGKKNTVIALIQLIKNEKGDWKLVSDIPIIL
jgi:ketosteroid isomerase-like protein